MRIVCQQTILMNYHALFVILKNSKIWNCCLQQIVGGALLVNIETNTMNSDQAAPKGVISLIWSILFAIKTSKIYKQKREQKTICH